MPRKRSDWRGTPPCSPLLFPPFKLLPFGQRSPFVRGSQGFSIYIGSKVAVGVFRARAWLNIIWWGTGVQPLLVHQGYFFLSLMLATGPRVLNSAPHAVLNLSCMLL